MGRALDMMGNSSRAAGYLVAAVQSGQAPVAVWRDLAGVLKRAGDIQGTITALQAALRLDQKDVESWFALGELAQEQGHADIIRDVGEIVRTLAPDDPRTLSYTPPQVQDFGTIR